MIRPTRPALLLAGMSIFAFLTGCTDFDDARHKEEHIAKLGETTHAPPEQIVSSVNAPYLLGEQLRDRETTPEILRAPASILIARPIGLRDAAILASRVTHIPVSVAPDAEDSDDDEGASLPSASGSFSGLNLPPPPSLTTAAASYPSRHRSSSPANWHGPSAWLSYDGTREGLFQAIATRFGIWQRFEDGQIRFFRNETKTFVVPTFPGSTNINTSITAYTGGGGQSGGLGGGGGGSGGGGMSGGGSGGSSGGSSSSGSSSGMTSISRESKTDRWKNLEKTAQTVANGGQVIADQGLGTLSVTGNPDQVARVSDWIHGLSESLMQQVAIEVHVYTLKITHETNYGFSPQIALKNYGKVYGLSMTPAAIPGLQTNDIPFSFGASILDSAKGAAGQFSGSQLAVQALSELGNVTEMYSRSAVATNGMSAPFQNGINTTYLASSSTVLASNAGSSATLSPGVVMSGFMGEVTPRIVDQRIMLHINFLLQTLLSIQNFSASGSSIQEPKTSSTSLDDTVVLHSGSTLMLSGYIDDASSRDRTGAGSPLLWLLGGGGDAQTQKTQVIVTVEAHTL